MARAQGSLNEKNGFQIEPGFSKSFTKFNAYIQTTGILCCLLYTSDAADE